MSEVLNAVVLKPVENITHELHKLQSSKIVVEHVGHEGGDQFEVGYLPALWKKLGEHHAAYVVSLLGDSGQGYFTSSMFVRFENDDDERGTITFANDFLNEAVEIIRTLINLSQERRILFFSERTYYVGDRIPADRYEPFTIDGPLQFETFISRHDLNQIFEQTIYIISE
jgi:hypothetical protein